jgi:hypothetical protein
MVCLGVYSRPSDRYEGTRVDYRMRDLERLGGSVTHCVLEGDGWNYDLVRLLNVKTMASTFLSPYLTDRRPPTNLLRLLTSHPPTRFLARDFDPGHHAYSQCRLEIGRGDRVFVLGTRNWRSTGFIFGGSVRSLDVLEGGEKEKFCGSWIEETRGLGGQRSYLTERPPLQATN